MEEHLASTQRFSLVVTIIMIFPMICFSVAILIFFPQYA